MDALGKLNRLDGLVGSTPLLKIDLLWRGRPRTVMAKAEYLNFTGSIKDRMAAHILRKALLAGELKPGDAIVEATSGNTGVSFSALGRLIGCEVVIYLPDWMSVERINLMKAYGADVRLVSREEGGFKGSIERAERMKIEDPEHVFLPRQFDNEDNCEAHYLSTGSEIVVQLARLGRRIDAFVAGVGTGGTVMGCGRRIKEFYPHATIHPLEPASSPPLSTGYKIGFHRIQGISDEFIPAILKLDQLAPVVSVDDGDAILAAQALSRNLGLGVGISSGGNLLGAVKLLNQLPEDQAQKATVTTVFVDDNKKYLSTDYANFEEPREGYITPEIELLEVSSIRA